MTAFDIFTYIIIKNHIYLFAELHGEFKEKQLVSFSTAVKIN